MALQFTSTPAVVSTVSAQNTPVLQEPNYSVSTFDYVMEAVASALNVYYTPALILLGSVGNLLSVFVFYTSKLRLQSTSLYLSALALSDTVFLLQLLPPWLNAIQFTSLFHRAGFCQVFVYTSYVSCFLSAWLVVAFTMERFVAVLYPLRRNSMCTVTRAKHIIFGLVMVALLLNIPVLKFASTSTNDCNIDLEYMEHAARFNIIDTALSFTTPLTIIIVLNTWIMVGVYRLERTRHALVKAEQSARPNAASTTLNTVCVPSGSCRRNQARTSEPRSHFGTPHSRNRARAQHPHGSARPSPPQALLRSQNRVTRMLLIVSTVFVMLNLPAYTMRVLAYAYDMSSDEYSGNRAALQQLGLLFFNTNFGINFILYCLTGQNFRRALCQSIPWLRHRARRGAAVRRASCHAARASSVSTSYASATDATSNYATTTSLSCGAKHHVRRHRSEPVIKRWKFDNSRSQRVPDLLPETIEMETFAPAASQPDRSRCPEGQRQEAVPEYRRIPYVLFPYRNLISRSKVDRDGQSAVYR